jgi:serine protease inhibitor
MMAGKFKVLRGGSKDLRCRLLELPFVGKRLSMFIILPDEDSEQPDGSSGLASLEKNLTAANLKKLFATLRVRLHNLLLQMSS